MHTVYFIHLSFRLSQDPFNQDEVWDDLELLGLEEEEEEPVVVKKQPKKVPLKPSVRASLRAEERKNKMVVANEVAIRENTISSDEKESVMNDVTEEEENVNTSDENDNTDNNEEVEKIIISSDDPDTGEEISIDELTNTD